MSLFGIGEYFPPVSHRARIIRYRDNKKLFMGKHFDVFKRVQDGLSRRQNEIVYIAANLPGIICKKSADFLFGESPHYTAGKTDDAPEQKAIERFVTENELNITNYESALGNAYRGDSFYKVRYGQYYGGMVDKKYDPFKVYIEAQNAEYVFPETVPGDANKILCFHIAYPLMVTGRDGEDWILNVESHYPGVIHYRKFRMKPITLTVDNEITEWRIYAEILDDHSEVETGVSLPLVVHVPN